MNPGRKAPEGESTYVPEDRLVEMLRRGEEDAFKEFQRRYRPLITAWLRSSCIDEEDIKDIVQDILIELYLEAKKLGPMRLSVWVCRRTSHAVLAHDRRETRARRIFVEPQGSGPVVQHLFG